MQSAACSGAKCSKNKAATSSVRLPTPNFLNTDLRWSCIACSGSISSRAIIRSDRPRATAASGAVGSTVTWTYKVTTTGNVPLSSVTVTDNVAGVTPAYQSGDANTESGGNFT